MVTTVLLKLIELTLVKYGWFRIGTPWIDQSNRTETGLDLQFCWFPLHAKLLEMGEQVIDFDWLLIAIGVGSNNDTATTDSGSDRTRSLTLNISRL